MEKRHSNNVDTTDSKGKPRKIYHPPILTVYGRVDRLTQSNGLSSDTDAALGTCSENNPVACGSDIAS